MQSVLDWRPTASIDILRRRAGLLARLRQFFADRQVLEVETPCLGHYSITDPYIEVLKADHPLEGAQMFLQTSPEYAMKRLLAAGSGPIYQIARVFRRDECGSRHNPEFTLLEWYQPGYDHRQLMAEVADLLQFALGLPQCRYVSYRQAFVEVLQVDPHRLSCREAEQLARQSLDVQMTSDCRDDWLNLLLAELIEPALGIDQPTFLYDYPASQAALAKVDIDAEGVAVGRRFELYINGIEIANGYHELVDAAEQARRFDDDNRRRRELGVKSREADPRLLAAMQHGLPECAGVALGLDRLLMIALGKKDIREVLSFPLERA